MSPSTSEAWQPGRIVGGCVLVEPLSSGSMGEVWLAVREGAHGFRLPVAIKRLHPSLADDAEMVRMFLDESRLLATLTHPGVVRVLDVGESAAAVFAVLEHVDGETLATLFRRSSGPMPVAVAVGIARALADALHYVHTRPGGVVHRDVSPRNVLVTRDGVVKLLDFGIARSALRRTQTEAGGLRGTLAYMAPEQARGERVDGRADEFSVAVLLFELLTGTRLYGERSEVELLSFVASRDGRVGDVRTRGAPLPEALAAVVDRALHRDVDARFPTLQAFSEALAAFAEPDVIATFMRRVAPTPPGPRRWEHVITPPRRRARWPLIAVPLAALVGVGAWWVTRAEPSTPPVVERVEPLPEPAPPPVATTPEPPPVDAGVEARAPRPKAAPARLTLKTVPWTHVYLGRRLLGETPLVSVSIPPGTHQLRLVNDEAGVATSVEVQLSPGENKTLSLHLQ